ncbi:MAG: transglycosylase SLT domain-containing protein [Telluria sp.]
MREIRAIVKANNRSEIDDDVIVCQIYMESRFDPNAHPAGSSARGLMQLLKAAVRELYRLDDLQRPRKERKSEHDRNSAADAFHDSPEFIDDATSVRVGTEYLQVLIDQERRRGASAPIVEAYKDYRGVRNGIYYDKIHTAAEKLAKDPENMSILREMVK